MLLNKTIDAFAGIFEERLLKSLKKSKAGRTGKLRASIKVTAAHFPGERHQVTVSFLERGKHLDMGTSRHVPFGDALKIKKRPGRRWQSKTVGKEAFKLSFIASEKAGKIIIASIADALPNEIKMN